LEFRSYMPIRSLYKLNSRQVIQFLYFNIKIVKMFISCFYGRFNILILGDFNRYQYSYKLNWLIAAEFYQSHGCVQS